MGVAFELRKRMKNSVVFSRSPQNVKFGHFTLLFCMRRGKERNVPKFKTHVQGDIFFSLNLLFCGVVVAVVVTLVPYSSVTLLSGTCLTCFPDVVVLFHYSLHTFT